METLEARAKELSDDPLQSFLIFLNVYAQMMDDMETLHPGCMVATVTYQERMFDAEVKQMNVDYLLRMRARLARWLEEIVAKYPPRSRSTSTTLADQLDGRSSKARSSSRRHFSDEGMMGRQTRLFRNHIKLLFSA